MISSSVTFRGKIFERDITNKSITQAIENTADWAQNRFKSATPVRSGRMRDGWTATPQRRELFITNNVPYADIVSRRVGLYGKTIPMAEQRLRQELRSIYDSL
ncbi:HK97 gp10 family phage protein [Nostoc sp. FACHB-87]|uniref:HK97 gp10 family phage protein n=1 Tax=Nostocaceae TaxID=1162 RepID=UPI001684A825|nr:MULTISPECIES: HK97 gp10 family phage protein [Nostocaceae]MBD2457972.1 HK97 gp10 family phage protein [Nostoc sp. FACHB-87]MBD2479251.1 HK97 gp10 family phage protein [Anabaena sp. FACHB-83]